MFGCMYVWNVLIYVSAVHTHRLHSTRWHPSVRIAPPSHRAYSLLCGDLPRNTAVIEPCRVWKTPCFSYLAVWIYSHTKTRPGYTLILPPRLYQALQSSTHIENVSPVENIEECSQCARIVPLAACNGTNFSNLRSGLYFSTFHHWNYFRIFHRIYRMYVLVGARWL